MTDKAFLALVDVAIAKLPAAAKAQMSNVAITIADGPTETQRFTLGLADDETLFGLYEGVPKTERGLEEEPVLPDKITVFKVPILTTYTDPAERVACIANTIWHELAHHVGWDEEWVTAEEERRGREL